jgi:hypothetical protein
MSSKGFVSYDTIICHEQRRLLLCDHWPRGCPLRSAAASTSVQAGQELIWLPHAYKMHALTL